MEGGRTVEKRRTQNDTQRSPLAFLAVHGLQTYTRGKVQDMQSLHEETHRFHEGILVPMEEGDLETGAGPVGRSTSQVSRDKKGVLLKLSLEGDKRAVSLERAYRLAQTLAVLTRERSATKGPRRKTLYSGRENDSPSGQPATAG